MPTKTPEAPKARRSSVPEALGGTAVGRGIYPIRDAARYCGLSSSTVRRCLVGHEYVTRRGERRFIRPRFRGDYVTPGVRGGVRAASFRDLVELRIVSGLLAHGVTLREVRAVGERLAQRYGVSHPFCTRRFRVFDGSVVAELGDAAGMRRFLEIARDQVLMSTIVSPFLRDVTFDGDVPVLWEPQIAGGLVVVDPARSFGQPIVKRGGVATETLYGQWLAWARSTARVARWYRIPEESVEAAVAFEEAHPAHRKRAA